MLIASFRGDTADFNSASEATQENTSYISKNFFEFDGNGSMKPTEFQKERTRQSIERRQL
ncbi:hypothetical protein BSK56_33525 [Paenibacillus borealis]|uniref:Uncharacterized protein n=1 Tax=Paenibacillus borealis TaxID=160799 RepID=A0ABX3GT38_PAEBO|nr:hypothetical protein BSK56_33525 [Paenibacillus borealis]